MTNSDKNTYTTQSKENPLSSPDFSFDSTKRVWTSWDIGDDGTAIGFFQVHDANATFIDFEEGKSILDIAHYANKNHILPWDAFRQDVLNIPLFGNPPLDSPFHSLTTQKVSHLTKSDK
jgi:hypothetical protein